MYLCDMLFYEFGSHSCCCHVVMVFKGKRATGNLTSRTPGVSVWRHYSIMTLLHDVDKLISLNSQLLMTKGGWGVLLLIAHLT